MKFSPTLLALGALVWTGFAANAAKIPAMPSASNPLKETVAALAEKEKRPAPDYAKMAEQTISFGSNPELVSQLNAPAQETPDPQGPWRNLVGDALAGVDEGEKIDPKAADWPDLREKLKRLQPPPPPPQGESKKDKQDKNKSQKKDQKQSKSYGKDQPEQALGGDPKSGQQEGGEGQEGKGESGGPPSQGQEGKGNKKGSKEKGDTEASAEGEERSEKKESGGKDPNQIRDFSNSKAGEGQMKERGRNEDMKGMKDDQAGFGNLGQEKKGGKEQPGAGAGQSGQEERPEAPPGMRVVGGGSGQKANDKTSDPMTLEAMARLDQVRQADSPAILQQRLQPQDQRPQPSSLGKPW